MENMMESKYLSKGKVKGKGYWKKSIYVSTSNTGYWSKYGGGRYREDVSLPFWTCQACNEMQINILPSYLIEYPQGEFLKVCTMCRYITIRYNIKAFDQLVDKVRHTNLFSLIANLLTVPIQY